MSPYAKRKLNLEWQEWRIRAYNLERTLEHCDAAIRKIKGRLRSFDQALDLAYAQRRRAVVLQQLGEARARANALEWQLAPPPQRREGEIEVMGYPYYSASAEMLTDEACARQASPLPVVRIPKRETSRLPVVRVPSRRAVAPAYVTSAVPDLNFKTNAEYLAWARRATRGLPR